MENKKHKNNLKTRKKRVNLKGKKGIIHREGKMEKRSRGDGDWAELVLPYLPPADLASAAGACRSFRGLVRSITACRSSDASRGLEPRPVPFFNPSAAGAPYSYFLYIPFPLLPSSPRPVPQSWGGSTSTASAPPGPDLAIGSGCDCADCSVDSCPCAFEQGDVRRECGLSCGCGLDCLNRLTQRGIGVRLRIVRDLKKGWGLHAAEFIRRGEFICEYAGEFLTTEEARRRQKVYDELASNGRFSPALLVVREHLPSGKVCLRVNLDATKVGNVARFINHACDGGNLLTTLVRNSGSLLPRLCFFAATDIVEGEELTFSYGDARIRPRGLPCFCGTSACCGLLPSEET